MKRTESQAGIGAQQRRRPRWLAATLILLASSLLSSAGAGQEADPPLRDPEPPREDEPAPTPPAEASKPGDDVVLDEGFTPSERIPAGSRVSFPVDI